MATVCRIVHAALQHRACRTLPSRWRGARCARVESLARRPRTTLGNGCREDPMFLKAFFGEVDNPHPCGSCQGDDLLDFDVRMAFQPIVDSDTRGIFAYEALVRGMDGEPAGTVISRVRPE